MTDRENFISIAKRTGYERMPVHFDMCPALTEKFEAYIKEHPIEIPRYADYVSELPASAADRSVFLNHYYKEKTFKNGTDISSWGVAREPGSEAALHTTYMYHPMEHFDSVEQILEYPFPVFSKTSLPAIAAEVSAIHAAGRPAVAPLYGTIWEKAWHLRSMEDLMCDMFTEDEMATVLLDKVTEASVLRAQIYAEAGVDAIFLGDDIGMQHTTMMSVSLYEEWLMPRLKKVIDAAKAINPNVLIFYHSCGRVIELIPSLIKAGIDVLNPVQPETMDFRMLHEQYGNQLSFHGTIGIQELMPYGTPDDVRQAVFENLDIAGEKGGLFVCPTHVMQPEIPVQNIIAYIQACADYTR